MKNATTAQRNGTATAVSAISVTASLPSALAEDAVDERAYQRQRDDGDEQGEVVRRKDSLERVHDRRLSA